MGWQTRPVECAPDRPEPWEPAPVLDIGTLPAGYTMNLALGPATSLMPVPAVIQPLLGTMTLGAFVLGTPARDPGVGAWIREAGLPAGILGEIGQVQYVPVDIPDCTVGTLVIGESYIGVSPGIHGEID